MDSSETTRQILKKVRQVEIATKCLVTDAMSGAYHSSFRGQGMDFEEVREYTIGDDVRNIDWNVTAKMDKPYVKVFREERELTLMLLVDLSASGNFGSSEQSKRELAAEVASVLAFSAVKNNDKVGLVLFTDKVEKCIPPKKGRQHVLRVIREILFYKPEQSGTNISGALDYMNRILRHKSVCFLISDFLQENDADHLSSKKHSDSPLLRSLALTNNRHDLICITLSDPREMELPNIGLVTLEDAETGEIIEIDTASSRTRERYAAQNKMRVDALKRRMMQQGIDILPLSTDKPYIHTLQRFFQKRAARK